MPLEEKIKALVHYICHKCEDSSRLGAVKLNKVFWFADSLAYKNTGQSISGSPYIKLQHGPVPLAVRPALQKLQQEGKIHIRESEHFGYKKTDFVSLQPPEEQHLNDKEREFINEIIDFVCNEHTARSISELSHGIIWEAAGLGEEIPMYAVMAGNFAPITTQDIQWADGVLERLS